MILEKFKKKDDIFPFMEMGFVYLAASSRRYEARMSRTCEDHEIFIQRTKRIGDVIIKTYEVPKAILMDAFVEVNDFAHELNSGKNLSPKDLGARIKSLVEQSRIASN